MIVGPPESPYEFGFFEVRWDLGEWLIRILTPRAVQRQVP